METWRTAQIFLSAQAAGVFEVEIDQASSALRCSCPVWKNKGICKHTRWVTSKIKVNHGKYTVPVPNHVDDSEIESALSDASKFREFILKYGKVEVI